MVADCCGGDSCRVAGAELVVRWRVGVWGSWRSEVPAVPWAPLMQNRLVDVAVTVEPDAERSLFQPCSSVIVLCGGSFR